MSGKASDKRKTPSGETKQQETHRAVDTHRAETHQAETHQVETSDLDGEKRPRWKTRVGPEREGEQWTLFQVLPEGRVATTGLIYDIVRGVKLKRKHLLQKEGVCRRRAKQMWEHRYIKGKQHVRP